MGGVLLAGLVAAADGFEDGMGGGCYWVCEGDGSECDQSRGLGAFRGELSE